MRTAAFDALRLHPHPEAVELGQVLAHAFAGQPSSANFVVAPLPSRGGAELAAALREQGILVRPVDTPDDVREADRGHFGDPDDRLVSRQSSRCLHWLVGGDPQVDGEIPFTVGKDGGFSRAARAGPGRWR